MHYKCQDKDKAKEFDLSSLSVWTNQSEKPTKAITVLSANQTSYEEYL